MQTAEVVRLHVTCKPKKDEIELLRWRNFIHITGLQPQLGSCAFPPIGTNLRPHSDYGRYSFVPEVRSLLVVTIGGEVWINTRFKEVIPEDWFTVPACIPEQLCPKGRSPQLISPKLLLSIPTPHLLMRSRDPYCNIRTHA